MPETSKWSLGVVYRGGRVIKIIPKDTLLPARRSFMVTSMEDDQPNVDLVIVLGEHAMVGDNYMLSRIKLDGIEKGPKGAPRVKLTFYSYTNGIYEVGVRYKKDDPEQMLTVIPTAGLSKAEADAVRTTATKYAEEHRPQEKDCAPESELPVIPLPAA